MPERKKYEISPAERQRRRDMARELHKRRDPVTGRPLLGGKQPGVGRPRKKRASEVLNQKIEDHAEEIWERLYENMKSKKEMVSLTAIRQMIDIANKEVDTQLKEERNVEHTSTEDLIEVVSSRLARLAESGKLPFDLTVEADVIEDSTGLPEGADDEDEPQGSGEVS